MTTIDELIELAPCPFCGSEPTVEEYYGLYHKASYCVYCLGCDVALEGDETREAAVARWNKRAPDPAISSLQEQKRKLEEALRDFMENPLYQVAVGGNPIAVDRMLERARALLSGGGEG